MNVQQHYVRIVYAVFYLQGWEGYFILVQSQITC